MDLIELETRAKKGENIPDGLDFEQHWLYIGFRCLYFMLKAKLCTVEEARSEKAEMLKEYDAIHRFRLRMIDDCERKAAVYNIIQKWDSPEDIPRKTWLYLLEIIDKCLAKDEGGNIEDDS